MWLDGSSVLLVTEGDAMGSVIDRLLAAVNAHDLDAMAALFDDAYDSSQPAHPGRAFVGGGQVRANWEAMFAGIPDVRAELIRSVVDDDTTWCEWAWSGMRTDGKPFETRGVTLFRIRGERIVAGTFYMEDVETDIVQLEDAVEKISGRRPRRA